MTLSQLFESPIAIHQLSSFRLGEAVFNLRGNVVAIVCKPLFLLVEQLNGLRNEFIGRLVGPTFHVPRDESFQFGTEANRHTCNLASKRRAVNFRANHLCPLQ